MKPLLLLSLFCTVARAEAQFFPNASINGNPTIQNEVHVAKSGSDSSGARNSPDKPFLTYRAAAAVAQPGDTIIVHPGTWTNNNWLVKGVNLRTEVGAVIQYTQATTNGTDPGYGIIDDRATGATTNNIEFGDDVYWSGGTNGVYNSDDVNLMISNTNAIGALSITNANTKLTIHGKTLYVTSYNALINPAAIFVGNCNKQTLIHFDNVLDWTGTLPVTDTGSGSFPLALNTQTGVFWTNGSFTLEIPGLLSVGSNGLSYSIWGEAPFATNLAADMRFFGGYIVGKIYINQDSPNWREWFFFQEIDVATNNPHVGALSVPASVVSIFGSGKHYIFCQKLQARSGATTVDAGTDPGAGLRDAEVWITSDKMTANGSSLWAEAFGTGKFVLTVKTYEDLQGTVTTGFINAGTGLFQINGGEAICGGIGLLNSAAGRFEANDFTIVTTNSNSSGNLPVKTSASGMMLRGCKLVAPAACTNAIFASSAQTVGCYWTAGNKTNSPNITLYPTNLNYVVDSNVR